VMSVCHDNCDDGDAAAAAAGACDAVCLSMMVVCLC